MELIRLFDAITRGDLALAGGKGANLGEMVRAGLPVPPGFVLLTSAYRLFIQEAGIQTEIERLADSVDADSQESLDTASQRIRQLFDQGVVPPEVATAIAEAYAKLGATSVAVRSSATAEDLPDASFAGQQETYLNIQGAEPVVQAVKRCWSSLWTGRALSYRIKNGIAPTDVALAVVVQRMVEADVAGVLFTADPISGHRGRMIIDGAWGLGESIVGGLVSPDNWIADGTTGAILREQIATKTVMTVRTSTGTEERPVPLDLQDNPVLNATQVAALIELGRRTASYFGAPQDVEWALSQGEFQLVQSRPITTLFPLPQPTPPPSAGLRIYVTLQGMQGVLEPITPAGLGIFRALTRVIPRVLHLRVAVGGPSFVTVAAGRIYTDMTDLFRREPFRSLFSGDTIDSAMGQAVRDLLARSGQQLAPLPKQGKLPLPLSSVPKGLVLAIAGRFLRALVSPDRARRRTKQQVEACIAALTAQSLQLQGVPDRVWFVEVALSSVFTGVLTRTVPVWLSGQAAISLAKKKLQTWGFDPGLLEPVGRSIPHNPTTEMNLALWRLSRAFLAEGTKPQADHPAVQGWLDQYGHRAVREIDLGIPRWREEPGALAPVASVPSRRHQTAG